MNYIKKIVLALLVSSAVFTISPVTSFEFSPKVEITTVVNIS